MSFSYAAPIVSLASISYALARIQTLHYCFGLFSFFFRFITLDLTETDWTM